MSILQKTSDITLQILAALRKAEKEILLQMYYVDNDEVFEAYAKILIEKSKQGLLVHCLFDALGARTIPGSKIEEQLLQAGVHIRYFNWLTPWAGNNKKLLYFRNHKRSLIIDESSVYIGGWCIGKTTEDWIEACVESTNSDVVQHSLADFWNMRTYAKKTQLRFRNQKRFTFSRDKHISYVYQSPLLKERYIYYTDKKLIRESTKQIVLIAPYFAPTYGFKRAIYAAQKRGVHVEIYIPKKTDLPFADLVARTYVSTFLKLGVSIYISNTMIHAKVDLFDDVLYVGSLNLDAISLRYNFENGVYIQDGLAIQDFEHDLHKLRNNCHRITQEEWDNRSWFTKVLDFCMKIFRGFV
jgi:cardiolipin synthase